LVALFWGAVDDLEDQLANRSLRFELHVERADIPYFQLQGTAWIGVVILLVPEASVDGWRGYVNSNAQARKTALSLHASRQARAVWKPQFLHGPAKNKGTSLHAEAVGRDDEPLAAIAQHLGEVIVRVERRNGHLDPGDAWLFPENDVFG